MKSLKNDKRLMLNLMIKNLNSQKDFDWETVFSKVAKDDKPDESLKLFLFCHFIPLPLCSIKHGTNGKCINCKNIPIKFFYSLDKLLAFGGSGRVFECSEFRDISTIGSNKLNPTGHKFAVKIGFPLGHKSRINYMNEYNIVKNICHVNDKKNEYILPFNSILACCGMECLFTPLMHGTLYKLIQIYRNQRSDFTNDNMKFVLKYVISII